MYVNINKQFLGGGISDLQRTLVRPPLMFFSSSVLLEPVTEKPLHLHNEMHVQRK